MYWEAAIKSFDEIPDHYLEGNSILFFPTYIRLFASKKYFVRRDMLH
jgi:hypothetical protein